MKNILLLIFYLIRSCFSVIPSWAFENLAIDLLSDNSEDITLYSKDDISLIKKIRKSGSTISQENVLTFGSILTETVQYEDISIYYKNVINCYLVCPYGTFFLQKIQSSGSSIINPQFNKVNDNWGLRCCLHSTTGAFITFYTNNGESNIVSSTDNGANWKSSNKVTGELYDFKISSSGNNDEYPFMYIGNIGGDNLKLCGTKITLKYGEEHHFSGGQQKYICKTKSKTQAYFLENSHIFYFVTYDDTTLRSGYSTTNPISNFVDPTNCYVVVNDVSPFNFVDNIKIKEINLIRETQYAYYEIYNINKTITYHGLIDIKQNKVLYNFEETITKFMPYRGYSDMLAITPTSAYKICVVKSGSSCTSICSDLLLDTDGNKCGNSCGVGKVKMMPEGVCVSKDSCDLNYLTLNGNETECGPCDYFYPVVKPYKLINSEGCLSSVPANSEIYKSDSYLYKCKENYRVVNQQCLPASCYERCETCSATSSDINNQNCLTCKEAFPILDNGNCKTAPTTVITTVFTPPQTTIIDVIPTTIVNAIPTTIITDTPEIKITTTIPTILVTETPTNTPETEYVGSCTNERCLTCSAASNSKKLCTSCDEDRYKKVNYTDTYPDFVDCVESKILETKYYFDSETQQYKPCYKYCKKCSGHGNATNNNCLECENGYMLRPISNPHNNCVIYADFYYLSPYNEYKPLSSPQCPEIAKYKVEDKENNKTFCVYDCKITVNYPYLYNGKCFSNCPESTSNDGNYMCKETDNNKIYITNDTIYFSSNDTIKIIEVLAKSYAEEFNYTDNHISTFSDYQSNILLYKSPRIIGRSGLTAPNIDFGDCYEKVREYYNITQNLIIAIADKKVKNNPSTFYLFFHPVSGIKLDAGKICENETIKVNENILSMLDENSDNYELQTALTKQGINIFDLNDPYFKDICYDFENPKKRDIALKDRVKESYVNVTLCDEGCINTGIDMKNNVAKCDCKFNDVTDNDLIHENAALEYVVGEIFDLINSSNIMVLKCYKYLLKNLKKSKGGLIILILYIICIICTSIFLTLELNKIKRYIFTLTEKFTSFLANFSQVIKFFPPRKSLKNKSSRSIAKKFEIKQEENNKNDLRNNHKRSTMIPFNQNSKNQTISKDILISKARKSQLLDIKEIPQEEKYNPYIEEGKRLKRYFKTYLETSLDEMEFDDAIKRDQRSFCRYFCDILQEKQSIAYTFIATDPINTRMIKFILFLLNIDLYLIVNGLFFSETFISELYHINDEDETFFSFIPRTIDKIFYTAFIASIISYMTDFFFIYEIKVKGIFKREKDNRLILKRNIAMLINEIQKRYISFIIMVHAIFIVSLYYILCFNYVYPKTQMEWIKSSILIIIIMQLLSLLRCLYETSFRFLSFKCESEKLYKLSKIFENNS